MSARTFGPGEVWIQTASGVAFDLIYPRAEDVRAGDLAHALSGINRFGGHLRVSHYSVAQHSILCAALLWQRTRDRLASAAALLHDAHEALVGDVATPVKEFLGEGWHVLERGVQLAVHQHFGVERAMREHRFTLKYADLRALATERRDLMPPHEADWPILKGFDPVSWIDLRDRDGMDWDDWKQAFLDKHAELSHRCEVMA